MTPDQIAALDLRLRRHPVVWYVQKRSKRRYVWISMSAYSTFDPVRSHAFTSRVLRDELMRFFSQYRAFDSSRLKLSIHQKEIPEFLERCDAWLVLKALHESEQAQSRA